MFSAFSRPLILLTLASAPSIALLGGPLAPAQAQIAVSEVAHQQFVFAYRLLQRGDTKLAIEAFDDYLGKFPRDEKRGDALYFRALLAKQQNQTVKAQQYLDEKAPAPTLVPASAVLLLKGEVAADLHQYELALKSLERIDLAELEPPLRASALFLQGQAYRGTKNLPAAAAQFDAAAKIDTPLRPRAQLELARVYAQLNQLPKAIDAAKIAATSGDPHIAPQAAKAAGDYAYRAGQYAPAADYYKIVLTNYSTSDEMSPSILGSMWAMLGMKQFPQIITAFDQYKTTLSPEDRVVAWYLTGSAYQEQGEHDKAAGMFNALVLGSTGSAVEDKAMYKLAYSQAELGQYDQAVQTTAQLRQKHPQSALNTDSEFLLASVEIKRGNSAAAIKRLSSIIDAGKQSPNYAQAILLRARFNESSNQLQAAAADYTAYLQATSTPNSAATITSDSILEASLRLIDISYRLGQFKDSAQAAASLLSRDDLPDATRELAWYRQALALIRLKEYEPAYGVLSTLIAKAPKSIYLPQTYYYRGLVGMALKKSGPAVTDLLAAADQATLPESLKINALRLVSIQQREAKASTDAVKTILKLEQLAGLPGLSAGELLWVSQDKLAQKDAKSALKYLRPIVARQVDSATDQRATAMHYTAQSLRMLDDLPAAVTAYRQAVSLGQGDQPYIRLELAATLAQQGNSREALDEFQGLINSEQSAVAAAALQQTALMYIDLARTAATTNDPAGSKQAYEEARKLLKRLVLLYAFEELSPIPQMGYVRLAEVEREMGNPDQSQAMLKELAEKYPNTAYADYAKAMSLTADPLRRGDAMFLFKKLLEAKPENQPDAELRKQVEAAIKSLETRQ